MARNSFIDAIEVREPCLEEWDAMEGDDRLRFCSHCAKNINNLSEMTRREAVRLVQQSGGKLCVRYIRDPKTNRPMFSPGLVRLARRTGVAAGVLGVSLAIAGGTFAQEDNAAPVQIERVSRNGGNSAKISGIVTDPNGAAIPYALVSLTNQDTNEYFVQNASAEGFYEFKDLAAGTYKVKFEAGGFDLKEVADVRVAEANEIRRDAQLAVQQISENVEIKASDQDLEQYVTVGIVTVIEARDPLVQAALSGDLEGVKARVMMRAKVNVKDKAYNGISPLHAAVDTGNIEIAQYLLDHGAKTNMRDFLKRTPLMMMDEDATPEMFELLVRYGAKVNLTDKEKNNVLHHFAAMYNAGELIGRIAAYGAPVNAVNKEGKTPLMIAAENGNRTVAKALLEAGADPNLLNDGDSAWDLADDREIKGLLETYGAVARNK